MVVKIPMENEMLLLPPPKGTCPACAIKHEPGDPHNRESLYYQCRFFALRGRGPTWQDAIAHCDDSTREFWEIELKRHELWRELPDGIEPIADPPHDSLRQVVRRPVNVMKHMGDQA